MEPEMTQIIVSKHEHEKNNHNYIASTHNVEKNKRMLKRNMKDIKMIQTNHLDVSNTMSEIKNT